MLCLAKLLQSCLTLCHPMDCSPPGSSACGFFQARILAQDVIFCSRGSSQPRDRTCISCVSCIGRQVLYHQHHLGSPSMSLLNDFQAQDFQVLEKMYKRNSVCWGRGDFTQMIMEKKLEVGWQKLSMEEFNKQQPQGQIQSTSYFCKESFVGTHAHWFMSVLSVAVFKLQWQN